MAVTLEIKDTAKGSKNLPSPAVEALESSVLPMEKKMGYVALGVWLGSLVLICLPWAFFESTQSTFAIGLPLWCLISTGVCLFLGKNLALRKLEQDAKARVSNQNQPAIKNVLNKVSPILGVDEPAAYVNSTAKSAHIGIYPQTQVINESLNKFVDNNELSALATRGIAHEKLGHSRRLGLIELLSVVEPPTVKLLVWPVWIYANLLEKLWLPYAMQNADRVALLVIRNQPLLLSAIVKQKAATDANMQSLGVTSADVTTWINQKGHIGMAGEEISTQYKLGRAIHEDPPFELRVQNLQRFADSADFKAAVEKLAASMKR